MDGNKNLPPLELSAFPILPSSPGTSNKPQPGQRDNASSWFRFNIHVHAELSKSRRRWRLAFLYIFASKALIPPHLAKEIEIISVNNKQLPSMFQHTDSYILDIPDADEIHQRAIQPIDLQKLNQIVKDKNLDDLRELGGVQGAAATLQIDLECGIRGNEDVIRRRDDFGSNTYQKPPPKGFVYFVLEAFKDNTILILLVCAILSLGFGIKENGPKDGWYDGGSISIAIFLVVIVSAGSNFRQSRQFEKLSSISNDIQVEVIRDSHRQKISIFNIVVGDVVCLKIGDQIPADGLFLDGYSLQVDESSMTGESDHVDVDASENPFLLSGAKVVDGHGRMLVTSVGMQTEWGKLMSSINCDSSERTPLQARLDKLTSSIGKIGLTVAFLVLVVLLVRYFTGNTEDENGNKEFDSNNTNVDKIFNAILRIVADSVTIVVVAIPEGLPLAVTLTLAYSMKQMMVDQAMVRKLSACETMGSATTICTDKTGTLTMNQMKVTEFWLGLEKMGNDALSTIATSVIELLHQGVGLNTTGNVYRPTSGAIPEFSGSPTEKAILSWAVSELSMDMEELKKNCTILHVESFNSEKKRSGISMKKKDEKTTHVHWKGAAEMILAMCSSYHESTEAMKPMDDDCRMKISQIIQDMAANSLRCIAFAHKKIIDEECRYSENKNAQQQCQEDGLTLLGLVGIKDPCRPGVKTAVKACEDAGVSIKMITGDNIFTARAIAIECGILKTNQDMNNGEIVEGVEFRNYTEEERMSKVDKIRVMARSSPFDKLLMVQCLKQKGHVVAVTGDGTNDAPALKEADIGLAMGIQGTEVAKESSDIVILDDNFASVVTVVRWGRCVYNNIQKFIQFQLTVNVAALVINFVAAVSAGEVPLTAVQLLWVNLIMDTLGALALATERPTKELMEKPPVGRTEPLITNVMWRNLMAQSLYQIIILLILQFKGTYIFKVNEKVKDTLIFNTFVLCQIFNEFNARKLEKKNVFEGIYKNWLFMGIIGITLIFQVIMVEILKKFADTERLDWGQWGVCIGIASMSWPIGWIFKHIPVPDKPFFSILKLQISKLL
ncbi:PREDICTED: calcium-transporting ATPase 12, plasma membrane-type-like [Nelumbo nucifera]|uniref:Calcium-transporting ATPase n=1 Tax=Nelumbo nucifera TaxID=4432 RepID=A0A1U8BP73_NELNU|nr:PREDICTED: calcium-transporting ATPase 12, plasma membrane-type-like [Nelumbo nucifera]